MAGKHNFNIRPRDSRSFFFVTPDGLRDLSFVSVDETGMVRYYADMIKALLALVCIIIPLFSSGTANAADYPEELLVVYTEWYPYTYKNGKGFEIEIFKAVMDKIGVRVILKEFPFKRCLKMIETGTAHAVVSVLDTPDRRRYIIFSGEYISVSRTLFFTRKESKVRYTGSLKDLKTYSIGTIAGFSYGTEFDNAKSLRKEEVLDAERLVKLVLGGRYDLGIENQAVIKGVAQKLGVETSLRFLAPPVHSRRLYVGFSKAAKLEGLADKFSAVLTEFKKTDQYRAILKKYGIARRDMVYKGEASTGD